MRFARRIGGAVSTLAIVVAGAAIVDLDPAIVTRPSAPADGIWVPVDATGEVVRVDAATGRVTARVDVADSGSRLQVAETGRRLVVVDERSGDIASIDRALHRVDRRVATGIRAASHIDVADDGIAVGNGADVAYVGIEVEQAVLLPEAGSYRSLAVHDDGALLATADHLVAVGPSGSTVLGVAATRPALVRMGNEVLWYDGNELRNPGGTRRGCVDSTPGPDSQWVADPSGLVATVDGESGVVGFTDTTAGTCRSVRIVAPGTRLGRPAVALGVIFVPEPEAGIVHIVDPTSPTELILDAVTAGSARLDVHTNGGVVVAHDPLTSVGAVLDATGVVRAIDTSTDAMPPERDEVALSAVDPTPAPGAGDPDSGDAVVVQSEAAAQAPPARATIAPSRPPSVLTASPETATTVTTVPPTTTTTTTLPPATTTTTTSTTSTTSTTTTTSTTSTTSTTLPPTTTTIGDDDGDTDDEADDGPKEGKGRGKQPKPPKGEGD